MNNLVPTFITTQLKNGVKFGQFQAACLFVDLTGYSTMTTALMGLGQHGAEVLATIMRNLFDPMINSVYQYGGFITTFSGDAFTALFPQSEDQTGICLDAVASALRLQEVIGQHHRQQTPAGEFEISGRVGVSNGEVSWGIISDTESKRASYYFRGSAINGCVSAEKLATSGEIILDEGIYKHLEDEIEVEKVEDHYRLVSLVGEPPAVQPLPERRVDHAEQNIFFPEGILTDRMEGEFRNIVNMFISLPTVRTEPQLEIFMQSLFKLQDTYGGVLNRLDFGDKGSHLLLFWGAPVTYENDIGRALNLILSLQSETSIPIKAGITYRISHAGFIGNDLQGEFTCYGQGVNLAARFMTEAGRGEVWVDEAISRRVDRFFDIEFVGEFEFKGFDRPEKTFALYERLEHIELFFSGPFLNRSEEIKFVREHIEKLWTNSQPEPLVVAGEPGIGKSRLIFEIRRDLPESMQASLWARCQTDQMLRSSFNPFRYWAKNYFEINDSHSDSRNKRNFNRKLDDLVMKTTDPKLAGELDRTRSFLGSLVNLYWEDSLYEQLEPKDRYENTIIALDSIFKAESLQQPVVIFIEDVQWLDDDSKILLNQLARTQKYDDSNAYPYLILTTSRDVCGEGCLGESLSYEQIVLEPLSDEDIILLARKIMDAPLETALEKLLVELAEGNPFFAEQILLYLKENNLVRQLDKGWELQDDQTTPLPEDIRALLVARMDQADPALKEVIQTASVLGRRFNPTLLSMMMKDRASVADQLEEGQQAMMWTEVESKEYVFKNNLLRDTAYKMQTHSQRQDLHRRAVTALEELYEDELEKVYPELAHHAQMAELTEKAVQYLFQAGSHAGQNFHNQQALEFFSRAIDLHPDQNDPYFLDLLLERESIHHLIGNREDQIKDLRLADRKATLLDDSGAQARINMNLARYYIAIGDYARSVNHTEVAIELAKIANKPEIESRARIIWADCARNQGQYAIAQEQALASVKMAKNHDDLATISQGLNSLTLTMGHLGRIAEAQEYVDQMLSIAPDIENLSVKAQTFSNASLLYKDMGNYPLAYSTSKKALELAQKTGDQRGKAIVNGNLGWISGLMGNYEESVTHLTQSIEIAKSIGDIGIHSLNLLNLSLFKTAQGDYVNSEKYATEALTTFEEVGHVPGQAFAWTFIGHAQVGDDRLQDAYDSYQQALALYRNLGVKHLSMEPLGGLAEVTRRTKGPHEAMEYVEPILEFLKTEERLTEIDQPFRVYVTCCKVLLALDHPEAVQFFNDAFDLLQEQANNIADDSWRESFLNNVPCHREMTILHQQLNKD